MKITLSSKKQSFFISLEELIERQNTCGFFINKVCTFVPQDELQEITHITHDDAKKRPVHYFYDTGICVWSEEFPRDNFEQFVELDKIFENRKFLHAHVDRSGNYAVAVAPDKSISLWDIAQNRLISTQQCKDTFKTPERIQWVDEHTIMLKDSGGGLWRIDARNLRLAELLDQHLRETEEQK